MKLRSRLTIFFTLLIFIVIVSMLFVIEFGINDLTTKNIKTAQESVQGITAANYRLSRDILADYSDKVIKEIAVGNYRLSQEILTRYGERIVEMKAGQVARELSLLLGHRDEYDYDRLRQDEKLRQIATQDIYAEFPERHRVGYIDVGDNSGVSVWHPNPEVEGRNFSEWSDVYPEMWEMVERSFREEEVEGYYKFIDRNNRERRKYMVIRQVKGTPFIAYAVVNIDEYFLPVHEEIKRKINATAQPLIENSSRQLAAIKQHGQEILKKIEYQIKSSAEGLSDQIKTKGFVLGMVILVLAGLGGWWRATVLSRPLQQLRDGVKKLGKGDFNVTVAGGGTTEVIELKKAFNRLGSQLLAYMDNLKEEVSAREAVESEIRIARRIQESLLPRSFPPFPEHSEFDLYAINLAAKEVAGDFYDFFLVDDHTLVLVIADVSGKGVPAALFMAVTRTLLKNICLHQSDPARALREANELLCQDNENAMFVTLILGCYDISKGSFLFANAGHDEMLLIRPDGTVTALGRLENMAMGIMVDQAYREDELILEAGDSLVFYTDGVTEAQSPSGEFFGRERLEQLLRENAAGTAEETCQRIKDAVVDFQQGSQFDDITVMVIKRQSMKTGGREEN